MTSEGCGERQRRGVTHVPPDVALPCLTTNISRGGTTNEYRTETAEGYVTPDEGENRLRPSPSRISSVQDLFERYITAVVASAVIQVTMSSATVTGEFGVRNGT
ncbi:hypothetical protein EHS25_006989 [Saitozyma podzolica]|uniref:Uncharacterized protein n=1 Tax=Saitozyma podzolica TaxID=1890683 RepID=A0A427XPS5_9TREE|nr:hypothetical protein EHS25_006989 [Saitozyma podzolica]